MMKLQYPYVPGNYLCDGSVHEVRPIRLSSVIGLPLLVFEYYDDAVKTPCVTVLSVDDQGIYKVPLLRYDEFFEIFDSDRWLEPVDIEVLPEMINANKPVRDWPELVATTPVETVCERKIVTLYIGGEAVALKDSDDGRYATFKRIPYDSLYSLLEEYDIIWRRIDESLVTNGDEISLVLRAFERELSSVRVSYRVCEIGLDNDTYPDRYRDRYNHLSKEETLPPYYGRHIHRYRVDIA